MGAVLQAQEENCLSCSNPWETFNKYLHQLWGLVQSWQIGVEQILFGCNAAIPGKMELREVGDPAETFKIFWLGVTTVRKHLWKNVPGMDRMGPLWDQEGV